MTMPERWRELMMARAEALRTIDMLENDIQAITERLTELGPSSVREITRAKDKRRKLREEVVETRHQARQLELEADALRITHD